MTNPIRRIYIPKTWVLLLYEKILSTIPSRVSGSKGSTKVFVVGTGTDGSSSMGFRGPVGLGLGVRGGQVDVGPRTEVEILINKTRVV